MGNIYMKFRVKDLEKETQLHTPSMLQVMILPKLKVKERGMQMLKHQLKKEQQTIFTITDSLVYLLK